MPLILKNSKGVTLVEVLVAVGIMAIATIGMLSIQAISLKQQTHSNTSFQADSIRRNLFSILNNDASWVKTIADVQNNPSFACLQPQAAAPCVAGQGGNIYAIHDANNQIYYDWLKNDGLTAQGTKCTTFNATSDKGNDACPLQFQISWTAVCGANCSCANVQGEVTIKAVYNPGTGSRIPFNASNYSSTIYLPVGAASSYCAAPCPAQTINSCSLPSVQDGATAGTCVAGDQGSCSYTCHSGFWFPNANTCTLAQKSFTVAIDCGGHFCAANQPTADQLCRQNGMTQAASFQSYNISGPNPNMPVGSGHGRICPNQDNYSGCTYTGAQATWNGSSWSSYWGGECNAGGKCTPAYGWSEISQVTCQ